MHLPNSTALPTSLLAAAFGSTSATYKFYWFLAILDQSEKRNWQISKKTLFAGMISHAWYTVNYFQVSFGKQDLIHQTAASLLQMEQLTVDIKKSELESILENSANVQTSRLLWHFNKNVPHWFLTPWLPRKKDSVENDGAYRNRIYSSSLDFENNCLYALSDDAIAINPAWQDYLHENVKVLRDFCYWNLASFLQSRNPNVPDINGKLIKPPFRGNLAAQRKYFWDIVFKERGTIECIFTDNKLHLGNYALDHFIPHAFVAHDLMWNLVPIDKGFNSRKSDRLVPLDPYFDKLFALQRDAVEIVMHHAPKNKYIEEYYPIFPFFASAADFLYDTYKETIQPLTSIAHNNGFLYL